MRVESQDTFVLRSQSYLETSLLVDVFSRDYGRLKLIVKGAKSKRSSKASKLQLFSELALSWQGKSDLKTVTSIDANPSSLSSPSRLVYGMYLNELLFYLVGEMDAHPALYGLYAQSLSQLDQTGNIESVLRNFEFGLLTDLGYAIDFSEDTDGRQLMRDDFYQYYPDSGFVLVSKNTAGAIPGEAIVDIFEHGLTTELALKAAKIVCKTHINLLLNGRELQSRKWHTNANK